MTTIKSSTEVSRIFTEGKRFNARSLTLLVYRNKEQHDCDGRVAFIAGKKLGSAVWRNRAKRRMRTLCYECKASWSGYDVLFIAKRATTEEPFSRLQEDRNILLKRAGLL